MTPSGGGGSKNPHNALFLDTFSDIKNASSLLGAILPQAITSHLDLDLLELTGDHWVDEQLHEVETDLLFHAPIAGADGDEALVYLLLEHQSTPDPRMPFRLLRYMVRIWDRWAREHEPARRLPPIIPVVLSHAPQGWTTARDFISLIDGPKALIDALRPHLPDFEPVIEDLARRSDQELEGLKLTALLRLVMLLMKHIRDGDVAQRLPSWRHAFVEAFDASGFDALVRVLMYIIEVADDVKLGDLGWIDAAVETPDGEVLMTLAERLRQEGHERGLHQGLQQGLQQGREEGREEGQEERAGRQRAMLLKLLKIRFGELEPHQDQRVRDASATELETMAERMLTAQTIDDILENES